jgi:hypothetical protein
MFHGDKNKTSSLSRVLTRGAGRKKAIAVAQEYTRLKIALPRRKPSTGQKVLRLQPGGVRRCQSHQTKLTETLREVYLPRSILKLTASYVVFHRTKTKEELIYFFYYIH